MKTYPHNLKTIKNENRALILNYIRTQPTSRASISKRSNMSKSAVTMITNDLIEEGQIVEIGVTSSSHGRKSILLDIVADYRYALGISIHRKYFYTCITDLKSNILAYSRHEMSTQNDPYALLDFAYGEILGFLGKLNIPLEKCIGIGVSAPGPLDYVSGKILNPPYCELFHQVDVGEHLRKLSGLPVMVDNNAVLLSMQQYVDDTKHRYSNYMFAVISDGIGSTVMSGGNVFRGFGGFASELGHTSVHADGIPCSCGNIGCLEKYISLRALHERFGISSYSELVDDAYMGDKSACDMLEYIAEEFSCAITNSINLFDLDAVIIYGQFCYRHEKLLALLTEKISRRSVITRTHNVDIIFSSMTPDRARASVCAAIIKRHFDQKL